MALKVFILIVISAAFALAGMGCGLSGGGDGTVEQLEKSGPVPLGVIAFEEFGDALADLRSSTYWGIAAADLDGDGHDDLVIGRHTQDVPLILFNNTAGVFTIRNEAIFPDLEDRDRRAPVIVDFNNDGLRDIYIGSGGGSPHELWRNDGDAQSFTDVWLDLPVRFIATESAGAVWFDWNNDTFPDVFALAEPGDTTATFAENRAGTGVFDDRTAELGLFNDPWGATGAAAIADYDEDGDLDMFIGNSTEGLTGGSVDGSARFYRQNDDGTFSDVLVELLSAEAQYYVTCPQFGDYDNDGDFDLYLARGYYNRGFGSENSGDGVNLAAPDRLDYFLRTNDTLGDGVDEFSVAVTEGTVVTAEPVEYRSFVPAPNPAAIFLGPGLVNPDAVPFDLTLSDTGLYGRPDLSQVGDYFWIEDDRVHVAQVGTGVGGYRYATGSLTIDGTFADAVPADLEPDPILYADRLYRNNGDGTFTEVTEDLGISNETHTAQAAWQDFDNDGWLDLVLLNFDYQLPVNRPFVVYRNEDGGGFSDVTDTAGFGPELNAVLTSLAVVDTDRDGFLDLVVGGETGPAPLGRRELRYYVNRGNSNGWLELELVGRRSNTGALGARIRLTAAGVTLSRVVGGGYRAFGQDSPVVHVGLGTATEVEGVVEWPSGVAQELPTLSVGQRVKVVEPG